jgi:hypothetical protein
MFVILMSGTFFLGQRYKGGKQRGHLLLFFSVEMETTQKKVLVILYV